MTGAGGMIGSALVEQVLEKFPDRLLRATFRTQPGEVVNDRLEWVQADLTNAESCRNVARGCSRAVMAAAETGGAKASADSPPRFLTDNLVMNALLLQELALAGAEQILFLSSSMTYPSSARPLLEEDQDLNQDPPPPFQGIGWSLRSSEQLLRYWHNQTGLRGVVLRLSYVYGPRSRFDPASSNFVPALIRRAVEKQNPFEIWGESSVVRDLLYVDDCCRAVVELLGATLTDWQEFNLSSGVGVTVGEVAQLVLRAAGHQATLLPRPTGPSSIPYRVLDNSRIQRQLCWRPQVSLQEGLERTVAWWREHASEWKR